MRLFVGLLIANHVQTLLLSILFETLNLVQGYRVDFGFMPIRLNEHFIQYTILTDKLLWLERLLLCLDHFFEMS